jgi:hypothetical protein
LKLLTSDLKERIEEKKSIPIDKNKESIHQNTFNVRDKQSGSEDFLNEKKLRKVADEAVKSLRLRYIYTCVYKYYKYIYESVYRNTFIYEYMYVYISIYTCLYRHI